MALTEVERAKRYREKYEVQRQKQGNNNKENVEPTIKLKRKKDQSQQLLSRITFA